MPTTTTNAHHQAVTLGVPVFAGPYLATSSHLWPPKAHLKSPMATYGHLKSTYGHLKST